jgi:hypothetical protein
MSLNPGEDAMQDQHRTHGKIGEQVEVTVLSDEIAGLGTKSAGAPNIDTEARVDALAILEALAGPVDAPPDWAAEHDHYLYGTPKRADSCG